MLDLVIAFLWEDLYIWLSILVLVGLSVIAVNFIQKYYTQKSDLDSFRVQSKVTLNDPSEVLTKKSALRRRVIQRRQQLVEPSDSENESDASKSNDEEKSEKLSSKVGVKKQRKIDAKKEAKAQRDADEILRKKKLEEHAKKEEEKREKELEEEEEEKRLEEEERKAKEEKERQDEEAYQLFKSQMIVEEEGQDDFAAGSEKEEKLKEFIEYIEKVKVIELEALAAQFQMKAPICIDLVKRLLDEGRLMGVIDDRGKFIYITLEEFKSVANFMRQRGRVSIADLVKYSNSLISLKPNADFESPSTESTIPC